MTRALFAVAYLIAYLAFSSSASPLFVLFGRYWQVVAAGSGVAFCVALVIVGWRLERPSVVLRSALWRGCRGTTPVASSSPSTTGSPTGASR